jgi:beta-galactosidase
MSAHRVTIAAFALLLAAAPLAQAPAPPRDGFFPVAVWYSGGKARAPMLSEIGPTSEGQWRDDLRTIKSLGFNTVRTWVEWSAGEPRRGEYRLENLELMLRLAEQEGLRVIVQVYVDSAPEWVGKAYPDGRFVSQAGVALPSQAAPGYCVDHDGVREAVHGFFREVARRASRSPAFCAYDAWSEPAVMNWALPTYLPNAQFCYCRHSMARFRRWLEAQHGSIETLNRRWYRTFASWDEVEPPRFGTILTYTDFTDWRVYIGEKIADDLAGRAAAIKQVDTAHPVTSHAPNPSPVFRTMADAMDASDDYLMKRAVDYFGTSFYPKLTSPDRDWPLERRALVMDTVRSVTAERGFYVGELQAGFGVHGIIAGNPITAGEIQLYTWGLVSRGAKAISYYAFYPMSTGYEAGGYGMIELDGTLTERSRAAGRTAALIHEHAPLLLAARPVPAEVAVIVNPLVPLLGGEQAYGDRRNLHRAVAGYHRMFFERNVPVEFPSAREMTPEALRRYRLVILPTPLLLTRGMADALEQYVREGGRLFTEARPGWQDERGHAEPVLPGFGWHRMFGVRETEVRPVKQASVTWNGKTFAGIVFAERFEAVDPAARVVATYEDGAPAAFERQHGKGAALILGTFAGEANQLEPVPGHPLADLLIDWASVSRPALTASSFVELRRMRAPSGEVVLLFNHGAVPATAKFTATLAGTPRAIREIVTATPLPPSGASFTLDVTVPAQGVRVYRVEY